MWMIYIRCIITFRGNFFGCCCFIRCIHANSKHPKSITPSECFFSFTFANSAIWISICKKEEKKKKHKIHTYNSDNNQQNDLSIVIGEQKNAER